MIACMLPDVCLFKHITYYNYTHCHANKMYYLIAFWFVIVLASVYNFMAAMCTERIKIQVFN